MKNMYQFIVYKETKGVTICTYKRKHMGYVDKTVYKYMRYCKISQIKYEIKQSISQVWQRRQLIETELLPLLK